MLSQLQDPLELASLPDENVEAVLREFFDENYNNLRLESGHQLAPDVKEAALQQVLMYWRKLQQIATKVTETEVKLTLPGQTSPGGLAFGIEGVVDIVHEDGKVTMYDLKTHDAEFIRANTQHYEGQLNVYAHIWQQLRERELHATAIVSTVLPQALREAILAGDEARQNREFERWNPIVEIPFDQDSVIETLREFGEVVDGIESGNFAPPPPSIIASRLPGQTGTFAQNQCRNCDARFSCPSFREFARNSQSASSLSFRAMFPPLESQAERDARLIAGLETDGIYIAPGHDGTASPVAEVQSRNGDAVASSSNEDAVASSSNGEAVSAVVDVEIVLASGDEGALAATGGDALCPPTKDEPSGAPAPLANEAAEKVVPVANNAEEAGGQSDWGIGSSGQRHPIGDFEGLAEFWPVILAGIERQHGTVAATCLASAKPITLTETHVVLQFSGDFDRAEAEHAACLGEWEQTMSAFLERPRSLIFVTELPAVASPGSIPTSSPSDGSEGEDVPAGAALTPLPTVEERMEALAGEVAELKELLARLLRGQSAPASSSPHSHLVQSHTVQSHTVADVVKLDAVSSPPDSDATTTNEPGSEFTAIESGTVTSVAMPAPRRGVIAVEVGPNSQFSTLDQAIMTVRVGTTLIVHGRQTLSVSLDQDVSLRGVDGAEIIVLDGTNWMSKGIHVEVANVGLRCGTPLVVPEAALILEEMALQGDVLVEGGHLQLNSCQIPDAAQFKLRAGATAFVQHCNLGAALFDAADSRAHFLACEVDVRNLNGEGEQWSFDNRFAADVVLVRPWPTTLRGNR